MIFSSTKIELLKEHFTRFEKILNQYYSENKQKQFFSSIEKIQNNFKLKIGFFKVINSDTWEKILTNRSINYSIHANKLAMDEIKKIRFRDAQAVALYNLYYSMVKEMSIGVLHGEFGLESIYFLTLLILILNYFQKKI